MNMSISFTAPFAPDIQAELQPDAASFEAEAGTFAALLVVPAPVQINPATPPSDKSFDPGEVPPGEFTEPIRPANTIEQKCPQVLPIRPEFGWPTTKVNAQSMLTRLSEATSDISTIDTNSHAESPAQTSKVAELTSDPRSESPLIRLSSAVNAPEVIPFGTLASKAENPGLDAPTQPFKPRRLPPIQTEPVKPPMPDLKGTPTASLNTLSEPIRLPSSATESKETAHNLTQPAGGQVESISSLQQEKLRRLDDTRFDSMTFPIPHLSDQNPPLQTRFRFQLSDLRESIGSPKDEIVPIPNNVGEITPSINAGDSLAYADSRVKESLTKNDPPHFLDTIGTEVSIDHKTTNRTEEPFTALNLNRAFSTKDLLERDINSNRQNEIEVAPLNVESPSLETASLTESPAARKSDPVHIDKLIPQIEPKVKDLVASIGTDDNQQSLKMQLHPSELGSVEITLVKHESGSVSARITAESEAAFASLNENMMQLRDSLENAGLQIEKIEVGHRSSSSPGQGGNNGSPTHGQAAFHQPDAVPDRGGISENTDDDQSRLVSLRA